MKNLLIFLLCAFPLIASAQIKPSQIQGLDSFIVDTVDDLFCCDEIAAQGESLDSILMQLIDGIPVTIENESIDVVVDFSELTDFLNDIVLDVNVTNEPLEIDFAELLDWLANNDLSISFDELTDWLAANALDVNVDFSDLIDYLAANELNVDGIDEIVACLDVIKNEGIPVTIENEPLDVTVDFGELTEWLAANELNVDFSELFDWLAANDLNVDFSELTDFLTDNALDVNVDFSDLTDYLDENQDELLMCLDSIKTLLQPTPTDPICETVIETACDIDDENELIEGITRQTEVCSDGSITFSWFTNFGTATQSTYEPVSGLFDCVTREEIPEPEPPPPLCDDWEIIDVYTLQGENGINKRVYAPITAALNGANNTTPSDVFNQDVDDTGMPGIDPSLNTTATTTVESDLNLIDGNNGRDAMQVWTYVYLDEGAYFRENRNTGETIDVYVGECCGDPILTASCDYSCSGATRVLEFGFLPAGRHFVGFEIFDWSVWSGLDVEYSYDEITWTNVPPSWLYTKKPTWEKCSLDYCPETSQYKDDDGLVSAANVERCAPVECDKPTVTERRCGLQTFYRLDLGEIGTTEQQWTTSAVTIPGAAGTEYTTGFTLTDSEGMPAHTNAPDATISNPNATTTNFSGLHQAQSDFYFCLDQDSDLREFNATAETSGVWLSEYCANEMVEVLNAPYLNNTANAIGRFAKGCYRARLYTADFSANGITRLQFSTDNGVTYSNIVAYKNAPVVETRKGWVCNDGVNYSQDESEILNPGEWSCDDPSCPPCCGSSASNDGDGEDFETIGDQATCQAAKLGATFFSTGPGVGVQQGAPFNGNGNMGSVQGVDYDGFYTVVDAAGTSHVFNPNETKTGMASGQVQSVTFTGWIFWNDGNNDYRCEVDKEISATFTVN